MKRVLLSFLMAMFSSAVATAADDSFHPDKLSALDAEITQAIADSKIVGGVLWVEREGVSYHKAFGNRALKPDVEPMTEDTIFDVASITKVT